MMWFHCFKVQEMVWWRTISFDIFNIKGTIKLFSIQGDHIFCFFVYFEDFFIPIVLSNTICFDIIRNGGKIFDIHYDIKFSNMVFYAGLPYFVLFGIFWRLCCANWLWPMISSDIIKTYRNIFDILNDIILFHKRWPYFVVFGYILKIMLCK